MQIYQKSVSLYDDFLKLNLIKKYLKLKKSNLTNLKFLKT